MGCGDSHDHADTAEHSDAEDTASAEPTDTGEDHTKCTGAEQMYMAGPARLNFGDCFAYGLARTLEEPLLFVGQDVSKTDVQIA